MKTSARFKIASLLLVLNLFVISNATLATSARSEKPRPAVAPQSMLDTDIMAMVAAAVGAAGHESLYAYPEYRCSSSGCVVQSGSTNITATR